MSSTVYKCEGCGGVMEFDAKAQCLKCPNCGNSENVKSNDGIIEEHTLTIDAKRSIKVEMKETQTMECKGCGALIEVSGLETAKKCPYCGSAYVLADKQEETLIPDGVVPFKIDKNDAHERFNTWMKKRLLAPNELKNLYQRGGFQSIYVPYWTFDAQASFNYTAEGGRDRTVTRTGADGKTYRKVVTDWYFTSGHIEKFFDDIQVPASIRYKSGLFKGIEPFNLKQLLPYSPDYISGHLSENYSVGLEGGHRDAIGIMNDGVRSMAESNVRRRYDRVRSVRLSGGYSNETYKYILIPVYSTTYDYKGKNYTVMINGQTGKVSGLYPYSIAKIVLIVIVLIIVFCLFMYLSNS